MPIPSEGEEKHNINTGSNCLSKEKKKKKRKKKKNIGLNLVK